MRNLFIASDHAGFFIKSALIDVFSQSFNVVDLGTSNDERTDYTIFAHNLSRNIQKDSDTIGILICGSGIGVSIVANRYKGVRAAVVYSEKIAEICRQHNNANVACFGARYFSANEIIQMAKTFLSSEFIGGIHAERVANID